MTPWSKIVWSLRFAWFRRSLAKPPRGAVALQSLYSKPWANNAKWFRDNMVKIPLPPRLADQWKRYHVWFHRNAARPLIMALDAIATLGLAPLVPEWNGTYNLRKIRGGNRYSLHAYGVAIDLNGSKNKLGKPPSIDPAIVWVFEQCGFTWGGRWKRPDGMHFEFGGY